jgi:hypothetical protein
MSSRERESRPLRARCQRSEVLGFSDVLDGQSVWSNADLAMHVPREVAHHTPAYGGAEPGAEGESARKGQGGLTRLCPFLALC